MKITLLRHATLLVAFGGKTLLVDPMLSEKEAMPPIVNSSNERRNPLVELKAPANYLSAIDAVLLTHTHRDHFDDAAAEKLPKQKPVLCQPEDEAKLNELGFQNVIPVATEIEWQGIRIHRTGGQHGTGEIGRKMAPVSGYILEVDQEPSLYIAGDTIYCTEVQAALAGHDPAVTVVNGGGARFVQGDPITMTPEDVARLLAFAPQTQVVVVHLEAINHCLAVRADFRQALAAALIAGKAYIPEDGETISL